MKPALISCIVPVFNGARYLGEALDSILAQTYRAIEVIVADDGSTDGTPELAARYGNRIRYMRQDNAGPPTARNLGMSVAQGEFLAFLDADDLWHPAKLMRQMDRFTERPELDLCVTHLQNFWIAELADEAARLKHHRLAQALPGYVTGTLLARRALVDTVGPFAPALRYGDDTDWFLRAAECSAVMELLPDVLVYRRIHDRNISMEVGGRHMSVPMHDSLLEVVKRSLDRRRERSRVIAALNLPPPAGSQHDQTARRAAMARAEEPTGDKPETCSPRDKIVFGR